MAIRLGGLYRSPQAVAQTRRPGRNRGEEIAKRLQAQLIKQYASLPASQAARREEEEATQRRRFAQGMQARQQGLAEKRESRLTSAEGRYTEREKRRLAEEDQAPPQKEQAGPTLESLRKSQERSYGPGFDEFQQWQKSETSRKKLKAAADNADVAARKRSEYVRQERLNRMTISLGKQRVLKPEVIQKYLENRPEKATWDLAISLLEKYDEEIESGAFSSDVMAEAASQVLSDPTYGPEVFSTNKEEDMEEGPLHGQLGGRVMAVAKHLMNQKIAAEQSKISDITRLVMSLVNQATQEEAGRYSARPMLPPPAYTPPPLPANFGR